MQINNFILLFIIQLLLISCSEVSIVPKKKELNLGKNRIENRDWVYCTEKDRLNGKRTFNNAYDALCLKKKLRIGIYELYLKATILNSSADSDDKIGYNELILKKRKKIIKKIKLEEKGAPFYFTTGFAKIRKDVYQTDLNKDGIIEFALVNYGTERNRYTRAQIYSLQKNGSLDLYGLGTYNKDLGEHVMFGCPDCHTINLNACKSCY
jgi:hypothetical protein